MTKKLVLFFVFLLVVLLGILLANTLRFQSRQMQVDAIEPIPVDSASINRLSQAVQIPTISNADTNLFNSQPFVELHNFLQANYPLTHIRLQKDVVNKYSLLYFWQGSNPALKPALLLAHMDVVPVETEALANWTVPPFEGAIQDGFIWGRGTLDDKISVIAILEAVEILLQQGYTPERSFYLAFGHDEEVGGFGAKAMAELLDSRKVEAEWVLDEGYAVTKGLVPGMDKPVALIGTAEKGFTTVQMHVTMQGGHSSMPEKETPISVLARAMVKVTDNPLPTTITPPVQGFINYVGPEMPFLQKLVFANTWLFKPIILNTYQKTPSGNALVRTTTAPTILQSGVQENVLPTEARGAINFRLLPGHTSADIINHVNKAVNDPRVITSTTRFISNPSPVSPTDSEGFTVISTTIRQLYPEAIVAPNLVLGGTDARNYTSLSPNIYRFSPFPLTKEDLPRIHGINERIAIEDYKLSIGFYYQLIKNSSPANE
jgi:carboxypeptidase PM20D1